MVDKIMPTNPIGGKVNPQVVSTIIKIAKTIWDLFRKPAELAGKTDSINDNSSLENVDAIVQIFTDFKEKIREKAIVIEDAVGEEVEFYMEELQDMLQEKTEIAGKYGIQLKRMERQIEKIASRVKGSIDNEVAKKVSLDNVDCKAVVKMIPGTKKEEAMKTFLNQTVKHALDICCGELHNSMSEIYDDVEMEVLGAVESIQKKNEQFLEKFNAIDVDNYQETAKHQMTQAYYLCDVCDLVDEIL